MAAQDKSAQTALVLAVGSLAFGMLGTPLLAMSMYVMTLSRPEGTYPPIPCQDGELSPPLWPVAREDSPVIDQHYAVVEEILLNALDAERPGGREPVLYEQPKLRQKQLDALWGTGRDATAEESDAITDECASDDCGEKSQQMPFAPDYFMGRWGYPLQVMALCSRHEDEVTGNSGQNLQDLLRTQPQRLLDPPTVHSEDD